jgi:glycosyltransferase involved in cell wall biosynthesis
VVGLSVIIPLYNKEREVARAVRSVLAQTLQPLEIIVVDDGSTDNSAALVEAIANETCRFAPSIFDELAEPHESSEPSPEPSLRGVTQRSNPVIKLIRQPNAGETAARNRGMAEARGTHFALLDADDEWRPGFLEAIVGLVNDFPAAGLYCTGFDIARDALMVPGHTPASRGVVEDFFAVSMRMFVATASSSVLTRAAVERVGGFPEGMRLGGDQYMWTKVAIAYPVAFTPERLAVVHASASNRSATIYTPEKTGYNFLDFFDPSRPEVNEYAARVALGKAITATVRGGTNEGLRAERDFGYNRFSRRLWWRLWLLNRLPRCIRPLLNGLYSRLAWRFARRGF